MKSLGKLDSFLVGLAVCLGMSVVNWLVAVVTGFSFPFGLLAAIAVYFLVIRPHDGNALFYFIGYFALLIVLVVVLLVLFGGLLFLLLI